MEKLSIQYNGISVSSANRIYIEQCFRCISNLSPSDSSVLFSFIETPGGVSGDVTVVSRLKMFEANCSGNSIEIVMNNLRSKIEHQLEEWKKQRF